MAKWLMQITLLQPQVEGKLQTSNLNLHEEVEAPNISEAIDKGAATMKRTLTLLNTPDAASV